MRPSELFRLPSDAEPAQTVITTLSHERINFRGLTHIV